MREGGRSGRRRADGAPAPGGRHGAWSATTLVEEHEVGRRFGDENTEKADKLSQKFYQIDTGFTRKHSGYGLGLGICKGIIDAHGGRIWFDKSYRSGVAIKFGLPDRIRNN